MGGGKVTTIYRQIRVRYNSDNILLALIYQSNSKNGLERKINLLWYYNLKELKI